MHMYLPGSQASEMKFLFFGTSYTLQVSISNRV